MTVWPPDSDVRVLRSLEAAAVERANLYQFSSLVGAHQYVLLYRLVRRHIRPGAEILDWGAGNGHFSYFLVDAGYRTVGYSLYPGEVSAPLGESDFRLVVGDPSNPVGLPFADGSFDAVASVGVLEHVRETGGEEVASLREIRRLLRPGGHFICYHLPNRYSWVDAVARLVPGAIHHVYRFTRGDIRALVRSADLELLGAGSYALLPRNPLHVLPDLLAESERFAQAYDAADRVLGALLPALCTNHYFVARKPA